MGFGGIGIWQILILLVLAPIAFLPAIIAMMKNHPHKVPIMLANTVPILLVSFQGGVLLFGIGWLVALVWCFVYAVGNNK